ncbi:PAS domain-containing protein [Pseudomonas sp. PCH446]
MFNEGAEHMLGYRAAEVLGKATPAIFHLEQEVIERAAELSAEYGQVIEGFRVFAHKPEFEHSETREWTYVRKDGSQVPVSLVVTDLRDDEGN